ncbi:hypothetical protein J4Q44_G00111760 [Coregonus suidteri]|uniref:Uncharacterized protein n=1 Tax=Coregonus suidteri TaxID=861788 RepID=A0AAN8QVB4_9TELE
MTNKQYHWDTKKLMTLKRRCEVSHNNNLPLYQSDSEHLTAPPKHTICNYSLCITVVVIISVSGIFFFYFMQYMSYIAITVPEYCCVNSSRSPEQIHS